MATDDVFDLNEDLNVDEDSLKDDQPAEEADAGKAEAKSAEDKSAEPSEEKEEEVSLADLQERFKSLERESVGRLKDLKSEREKRQQLEGKVAAITEMVSKVRSAKTQDADGEHADETVKAGKKTIPVKFDGEGNPYIDAEDLKSLTATEVKSVEKQLGDKIERLEQNDVSSAQQLRIVNEVKSVLAMDSAYPQAFGRLEEAFAMMDRRATEMIERKGIDPKGLDLDQCIEILESDKSFLKEFKTKYPSVEIDAVIEARALTPSNRVNRRKMIRALDALKSTTETADGGAKPEVKKGGLSKTLKAITSARNLSSVKNHAGDQKSLDDISGLNMDDFMKLSDAEVKEFEKLLGAG